MQNSGFCTCLVGSLSTELHPQPLQCGILTHTLNIYFLLTHPPSPVAGLLPAPSIVSHSVFCHMIPFWLSCSSLSSHNPFSSLSPYPQSNFEGLTEGVWPLGFLETCCLARLYRINLRKLGPASFECRARAGFRDSWQHGSRHQCPGQAVMWGCSGDSWGHELIHSQPQHLAEDRSRASPCLFSLYKMGVIKPVS